MTDRMAGGTDCMFFRHAHQPQLRRQHEYSRRLQQHSSVSEIATLLKSRLLLSVCFHHHHHHYGRLHTIFQGQSVFTFLWEPAYTFSRGKAHSPSSGCLHKFLGGTASSLSFGSLHMVWYCTKFVRGQSPFAFFWAVGTRIQCFQTGKPI